VIVVFPLFVVRWEFWTVVIPIMMIELLTFYYFRKWIVHRYLVPRDYRRNEVLFDTALLATVSTSVTCPRCDANLELQSIGRNRTYVCGHCGATGAIAVIDKGEREVITRDRFGRPISGL
jgi:DNA-directed RNA polymerase subunit RPC12/RpoP